MGDGARVSSSIALAAVYQSTYANSRQLTLGGGACSSYGWAKHFASSLLLKQPGINVLVWPLLQLCIYDPKVQDEQIYLDLATPKFEWGERPAAYRLLRGCCALPE